LYAREEAKEQRPDVLHAAIRTIRLGTLVAADDAGIPLAAHIPFVLKTDSGHATLETHVARANPIWKLLREPRPVLVMFQGPHAYVRPGWYPAKQEHGKVVPTWSYVAVHARGLAGLMQDNDTLLRHVGELSDQQEAGSAQPWSVADAPDGYIAALSRGIVGISVPVDSLDGVWKLNQHRSQPDRTGMIEGLAARGDAHSAELAEIMLSIEETIPRL
jgi:transcriptional regulator